MSSRFVNPTTRYMKMDMQEINYKEMKFNPFNLIGDEWMLVTAGNCQKDREDAGKR